MLLSLLSRKKNQILIISLIRIQENNRATISSTDSKLAYIERNSQRCKEIRTRCFAQHQFCSRIAESSWPTQHIVTFDFGFSKVLSLLAILLFSKSAFFLVCLKFLPTPRAIEWTFTIIIIFDRLSDFSESPSLFPYPSAWPCFFLHLF